MKTPSNPTLARKLKIFLETPGQSISASLLRSLFQAHLDDFLHTVAFRREADWVFSQLRLHRAPDIMQVKPQSRRHMVLALIRRRTEAVWAPPKVSTKRKSV